MSFLIRFLIASVLAILSGLGVGGGSLLMIWLTVVADIPYPTAKFINLVFFIPPAVIASFFNYKKDRIRFHRIYPAILSGAISAYFFSILGRQFDAAFLKRVFGMLLLFTAYRELRFQPQNKQEASK